MVGYTASVCKLFQTVIFVVQCVILMSDQRHLFGYAMSATLGLMGEGALFAVLRVSPTHNIHGIFWPLNIFYHLL